MATPASQELTVLYRDDDCLFVHKPAGVPFHSEEGLEGFVSIVRSAFPNESLFPAHRLDKVTSGVMVFTRNAAANRQLSMLFEQRKVNKAYIALSDSKPKKKQGWIKGDMAKARNGSYKLLRSLNNPAITNFHSQASTVDTRLYAFILIPKTGKTHQLRVAMKSIGSPVLGDKRYKASDYSRVCLHSCAIEFRLNGKLYQVVDYDVEDSLFGSVLQSEECFSWATMRISPRVSDMLKSSSGKATKVFG